MTSGDNGIDDHAIDLSVVGAFERTEYHDVGFGFGDFLRRIFFVCWSGIEVELGRVVLIDRSESYVFLATPDIEHFFEAEFECFAISFDDGRTTDVDYAEFATLEEVV